MEGPSPARHCKTPDHASMLSRHTETRLHQWSSLKQPELASLQWRLNICRLVNVACWMAPAQPLDADAHLGEAAVGGRQLGVLVLQVLPRSDQLRRARGQPPVALRERRAQQRDLPVLAPAPAGGERLLT